MNIKNNVVGKFEMPD